MSSASRFFYIFEPLFRQQFQHLVPVVALDDNDAVFGVATGGAFVFQQLSQFFQFFIRSGKTFDDGGFFAAFSAFEPDAPCLFVSRDGFNRIGLRFRVKSGLGGKNGTSEGVKRVLGLALAHFICG